MKLIDVGELEFERDHDTWLGHLIPSQKSEEMVLNSQNCFEPNKNLKCASFAKKFERFKDSFLCRKLA